MYKALDFDVLTVFCQFSSKISPECKTNLNKLKRNKNHNLHIITDVEQLPDFEDRVIIDCIFGNGLNREVLGKYAEVIEKINESQNTVVSVDILLVCLAKIILKIMELK
jgi:NAD(P)H-hydrate epimerase